VLLDSNILIYFSKPGDEFLARWVGDPEAAVSIVSRIEALGFPELSHGESEAIESALQSLPVLPLTDAIAERAIALRRQRRMKLGDSIIAATALAIGAELVTRNVDDFRQIAGLQVINPFEGR
jgi:predicted nucleic acid-binding protein